MHDYPIAQESINTENNNIPFAIRVLDWESLMSMIGLQLSVVFYMFSATLRGAQWIEFNGDVKKGFFSIIRI